RSAAYLVWERASTQPPAAPLLPYTTLFRSRRATRRSRAARRDRLTERDELERRVHELGALVARGPARALPGLLRGIAGEHAERADRKSTRLNSSHLVSSYAVFCLKKKPRWRVSRSGPRSWTPASLRRGALSW